MKITEKQYLEALEVVKEYSKENNNGISFVNLNELPKNEGGSLCTVARIIHAKKDGETKPRDHYYLITPTGEVTPCNISIKIIDEALRSPVAICKFRVNIGKDIHVD